MIFPRALLPSFIILLTILTVGVYLWVMDPIINFSEAPQFDLTNRLFYTVVDRYEDNPDLVPEVDLSIVVPAFNEEKRIGQMLDKAITFLDDWCFYRNWKYEIVIVDDGSSDDTALLMMEYFDEKPDIIRLISLGANVGKGGAVKVGMLNAYGNYILMADADGATEIEDLDGLFAQMNHLEIESKHGIHKAPAGIVLGSRAHLAKESIAKREFYRTVLMKGFHLLVMMFATQNVQDTQCGFKLFTKSAAQTIFSTMHTTKWSFDIELIVIAEALGIPLREVPVNWHEVEGSKLITSKLDVVTTSLTMARDIVAIRIAYLMGFWTLPALPLEQDSPRTDL